MKREEKRGWKKGGERVEGGKGREGGRREGKRGWKEGREERVEGGMRKGETRKKPVIILYSEVYNYTKLMYSNTVT